MVGGTRGRQGRAKFSLHQAATVKVGWGAGWKAGSHATLRLSDEKGRIRGFATVKGGAVPE